MTEQYKPSDKIIEQIAREYKNRKIDYPLTEAEAYIKADICLQLPTINKALELYENQPQWQDKPDKVGWWCVMVKGEKCGWFWLYPPANTVYVSKQKGTIHIEAESYDFTLSEFLKRYTYGGIKFLYLPKPETYKEKRND